MSTTWLSTGERSGSARRSLRGSFKTSLGTHHCPLEDIPWNCRHLIIGTGVYGRLPVMEEVKREAQRRHVELLILPTADAIERLGQDPNDTNAILHVTC